MSDVISVEPETTVIMVETESTVGTELDPEVNVVTILDESDAITATDPDVTVILTDNESVIVMESDPEIVVISTGDEVTVLESVSEGPQGPPGQDGAPAYMRLVDNESETDMVYVGEASFGAEEDSSVWRIYKADFTGITNKKWAGGNAEFINKWSERLSLIY